MKKIQLLSEFVEQFDSNSILYKFAQNNPNVEIFSLFPSTKHLSSGIYCIFTIHNSRVYIGSAKNFQFRFRKHRFGLIHNNHYCKHMQRVFNKYGKDNLFVFLLEITEDLENTELKWIKYFDAVKNGYNAVEDTQRNFYDPNLIKTNVERMSKPVVALDLEGKYQMEFSSVSDAARYFNDQSTNISKCCKGKLRFIKGHIFLYKEEYDVFKSYKIIPRDYSRLKSEQFRKENSERLKGRIVTPKQRLSSSIKQGTKIYCVTDEIEFRSFKHAAKHYGIDPTSIKRSIEADRYCKKLKFIYSAYN